MKILLSEASIKFVLILEIRLENFIGKHVLRLAEKEELINMNDVCHHSEWLTREEAISELYLRYLLY